MFKTRLVAFVVCLWILGMGYDCLANGHGHQRPTKKGILLVAFGSSMPETRVAFDNIDRQVKAAFPGIPVQWAYTSVIIRQKLAKQGQYLDSPEVALAKMMEQGFTHVAVQSLHTIGGFEFHHLHRNAHLFAKMSEGFDRILVGYPLLSTDEDMARVSDAILANIPAARKKDEAVVLMGHGSHHPSNAFYAALMYRLQQKDPLVYIAGVEGWPEIDHVKDALVQKGTPKAWLMPFMAVAGDHARNDMAGPEPDSWHSILTAAGIQCEAVLKGTAEYDNMVAIWIDHLRSVLAHFD